MRTLIFCGIMLICGSAIAQSLPEQMRSCASITSDEERLACFDSVSRKLTQTAEKQFGQEARQVIEEAPESITAVITEVDKAAYNKSIITLDNGQIWRQTGSTRMIWKGGEQVIVERGVFGSFIMRKASGGRSIRVKRVK